MTEENMELSRRALLTTAVGSAAAGGAIGTATAQADGSSTTVTVGPGGSLVFEPGTAESLQITPGTTVEFVWDSDNHNIVVESQPDSANWEGHEPIENAGFSYTHTFETLGAYEYFCQPHKLQGWVQALRLLRASQRLHHPMFQRFRARRRHLVLPLL